ncbi:alpha/beta fold hydrolase [Polaribacter sp. R2A056_3_33]|uniref:alpha/beta fold hydrolase n=1 Tax=unclassified Polaribacter TaxID=196858 RepID=UPI001C4FA7C8|nr:MULTISPECIES: alpha/beta fold hydrolase [unclassified Polaribacter]QXP63100.1 alpha/beta fold hydrolase [Polaribacter sp. HaHaR_3_91]QXP71127.1 alpha/beta fold hydrolase [Polaribacter sp. R2A056_3_33]
MSKNQILHSTIKGEGKPLLILHGYFGMSDNWKTIGNQFAEDYQVHLIDQRNHGRSFHEDEFNYEVLVEDLHAYIEHYQLEEVNIIGHSMGGKTAMLFAVTYPDLVDKLIVVDISPRMYQPHHNAILAGLNSIDFSVENTRTLVDKKLSALIPDFGVRQFLLKNVYWKEKGKLAFRFNLESLTDNNPEVGEALPSFTVFEKDTLFLKGSKSDYITQDEEPIIEAHFPNSKIVEIKNAGHWLHAENPKDFYAEVSEFLS